MKEDSTKDCTAYRKRQKLIKAKKNKKIIIKEGKSGIEQKKIIKMQESWLKLAKWFEVKENK